MTIHALEAGDPLTVAEVRKYPTAHHRCGTEFLVILVLLSIFAFSLVGKQEPIVMILSRFIGIPILAAVGYEVLKIGAKFRHNPVMRVIMFPGILVQMITTKRPTDDMIEVAISSMEEALSADGNPIPAGSTVFDRDPLVLAQGRGDRTSQRTGGGGDDGRAAGSHVSDLDAKLAEVAAQYDDLQAELARPEVIADPNEIRRLGRELARLQPTVEAYRSLARLREELAGARDVRDASEGDDDLRQMARDEVARPREARSADCSMICASCCCRAIRMTIAT